MNDCGSLPSALTNFALSQSRGPGRESLCHALESSERIDCFRESECACRPDQRGLSRGVHERFENAYSARIAGRLAIRASRRTHGSPIACHRVKRLVAENRSRATRRPIANHIARRNLRETSRELAHRIRAERSRGHCESRTQASVRTRFTARRHLLDDERLRAIPSAITLLVSRGIPRLDVPQAHIAGCKANDPRGIGSARVAWFGSTESQ